jgi:hypothetical protein
MTTAAPSPTGHLDISLGEMRAALVAEGTRKGLSGAVAAALLSLLDLILALLADFRAGRLAAAAPQGVAAGAPCAADPSARPSPAAQERGRGGGCGGSARRLHPAWPVTRPKPPLCGRGGSTLIPARPHNEKESLRRRSAFFFRRRGVRARTRHGTDCPAGGEFKKFGLRVSRLGLPILFRFSNVIDRSHATADSANHHASVIVRRGGTLYGVWRCPACPSA